MRFEHVTREPGAFQESVTAEQVTAMAERAFGADTRVVSAVELSGGSYNTTYRVELADGPAMLRVAPRPEVQARIERELMRNEHAALPFFAPLAAMMPRTLCADWTRDIAGRDHVWQTVLPGVTGLSGYPRPLWRGFYRQLGTLTARVHAVRGTRFGPIAGPTFGTWSEAVLSLLADTAADLTDNGLDATDVLAVAADAERNRAVLDDITEPRLLHGDLWVANVQLADGAPEPVITGLLDHDRASWGDPAADWTQFVASQRPGTERDAFWETYGSAADSPSATWRTLVYRAAHTGAIRLERHRMGKHEKIPATYEDLSTILGQLAG
jgi:aminoglycoside phosphotransferase (APT) family kinase protein